MKYLVSSILEALGIEVSDESRLVKVVRKGEVRRRLPPKEGYKVVGNRYVKMSSREKRKRIIAAKKTARKRKGRSQSKSNRKRKRSLRKRSRFE